MKAELIPIPTPEPEVSIVLSHKEAENLRDILGSLCKSEFEAKCILTAYPTSQRLYGTIVDCIGIKR